MYQGTFEQTLTMFMSRMCWASPFLRTYMGEIWSKAQEKQTGNQLLNIWLLSSQTYFDAI